MYGTDPPLRPSDPEAFREQVYRRAGTLRRRRIVAGATATVLGATAAAALLFGQFLPLARPSGGQAAIRSSTSSSFVTTQPSGVSRSSTVPTPTTGPSTTQPPTTIGGHPSTSTPPVSVPAVSVPPTTSPPTTVSTVTTAPPGAQVHGGCGQPSAPATSASSLNLKHALVGTWIQCTGPSIFGPHSGGAVEILSNGTWRQLARTPGGWVPLEGNKDMGTWQIILPPTAVTAATSGPVRFVATDPPTASVAASAARTPEVWTARVSLTHGPHERAQFVEGTIVANYRRFVPSATGGSTAGA